MSNQLQNRPEVPLRIDLLADFQKGIDFFTMPAFLMRNRRLDRVHRPCHSVEVFGRQLRA